MQDAGCKSLVSSRIYLPSWFKSFCPLFAHNAKVLRHVHCEACGFYFYIWDDTFRAHSPQCFLPGLIVPQLPGTQEIGFIFRHLHVSRLQLATKYFWSLTRISHDSFERFCKSHPSPGARMEYRAELKMFESHALHTDALWFGPHHRRFAWCVAERFWSSVTRIRCFLWTNAETKRDNIDWSTRQWRPKWLRVGKRSRHVVIALKEESYSIGLGHTRCLLWGFFVTKRAFLLTLEKWKGDNKAFQTALN